MLSLTTQIKLFFHITLCRWIRLPPMASYLNTGWICPHQLGFRFLSLDWARKNQESRVKLHSLPFKLIYLFFVVGLASCLIPQRLYKVLMSYVWRWKLWSNLYSACYLAHWGCPINIKQEGFIESLYTIHFLVPPLCQLPVQNHYKKMGGWMD